MKLYVWIKEIQLLRLKTLSFDREKYCERTGENSTDVRNEISTET